MVGRPGRLHVMQVKALKPITWVHHVRVFHFGDRDGQIADDERDEHGQRHLGDAHLTLPGALLACLLLLRGLTCAVTLLATV